MAIFGWSGDLGGIWVAPAMLGLLLILMGLLLFIFPRLLAYFVAAVFFSAGLALLGSAWRMRQSVRYQRVRGAWRVSDEGSEDGGS